MHISVVGLGKLGSPLAAVLASSGHHVIGLDLNPTFVDRLNAGQAPVDEPLLQDLIDRSRGRLTATLDYREVIARSEITFVIVPTPSGADGKFTNRFVIEALEQIGRAIADKEGYHLVVVTSTVMPGSMDGVLRRTLEKASGRSLGETLGLCYNPEFIALGSVVRNMLAPDFLLIGESDARAGHLLERVYENVCQNTPPVRRMNFVNAELTKISVNTYVTTKISYANMLAEICERLPGADVDVVTTAVGADSRIGLKYLRGAVGYGGPCFPRDTVAFSALARQCGVIADLADATARVNHRQVHRLTGAVEARLRPGGIVGILGLSYKPDTGVIEESQGLALAASLASAGHTVTAYDPAAMPAAAKLLEKVTMAESAVACASVSDVLVITTPWPQFATLSPAAFANRDSRPAIIDCWRLLPRETFSEVADIVYLGRGSAASDTRTTLAAL
jgi:UDPglucose 6-dehydrogenase